MRCPGRRRPRPRRKWVDVRTSEMLPSNLMADGNDGSRDFLSFGRKTSRFRWGGCFEGAMKMNVQLESIYNSISGAMALLILIYIAVCAE